METFLEPQEKQKSNYKIFIVGSLIGVVILAVGIWFALQRPSMQDQAANILEGSYHEGSPEFAQITKDIVISTDSDTVVYSNAFGKISMSIKGKIRNRGKTVINGLEVNVAVVDQFNTLVKEKRVLVVPTQQETLGPDEVIPITLSLDGFERDDDRANIRWKVTAIRVQK
jgi:hypothetical protein